MRPVFDSPPAPQAEIMELPGSFPENSRFST